MVNNLLQTPILQPIKSYSAIDTHDFGFYYQGSSQIVKNNLVIERTSDNSVVYNKTIDSFALFHTVTGGSLTNGYEYKAKIRVADINDNWSDFSDWIVFSCYSYPILNITSIIDGVINSQTL